MKIIKDLVHGYVEIDELEEELIDTIYFQRLKDITQLTAQYAFPSATHNRFEHSLGVMHLSKKALFSLREQLFNEYKITEEKYLKLYINITIASLLHDVGHAPFSHLGELYFREEEIKYELEKIISVKKYAIDNRIFKKGSKHELMSCYVILSKFDEIIKSIKGKKYVDLIDYELICRCIVGSTYFQEDRWMENLIIQILNSNTIDTDKLDYLMRDAQMTGISVPVIDTARFFAGILIHPITKKITFSSKALPVVQNIIDARDSLYLWVYNHHITVYTDFVMEFYLKHLIANYEAKNKFKDKLNPYDYFSCDAIINKLPTNSDLNTKFKEPFTYIKTNDASDYTKNILPQLMERSFLKPLWKTIYEYNKFLENNVDDDNLIDDITSKLCDKNYVYRRYIVTKIIESCKLRLGDVFIVPRSNKFYSLNVKNVFSVYLDRFNTNINKLLPQRDFRQLYNDVAFYVFGKEDKLDIIKDQFIKIIKQPIPHEDELPKGATVLEWFTFKNPRG